MKRLVILAGPNGSGKSTLFHQVKLAPGFPENYINPDEIVRLKDFAEIADETERYHRAMDYAEELRYRILAKSESLAFETVLSKPDKLEFMRDAKEQGYLVELVFITTRDPEINIGRVKQRVQSKKGHDVPPEKIIERYSRCMDQLAEAVHIADIVKVYDNSGERPALVFYKPLQENPVLTNSEYRDDWVDTYIIEPLLRSGDLDGYPEDLDADEMQQRFEGQFIPDLR